MSDVRNKFISGISWSLLGQFFSQLFTLLVTVALARLLSPVEFGLVGLVTVLTGFAKTIVDFGFGNALIYSNEITQVDKSSVFWANLVVSGVLTGLYIGLSGVIATFYNEPNLETITMILSLLFVVNSVSIVNTAMLRKALEFKTLFKINLISQVVSGALAVFLAGNGYGYWAIVGQILISSVISSFLNFYFVRWFPSLVFSKSSLKKLVGYSWGLVGTSSLNYWVRNIDNLLIGKFVGTAQLGLYSRAYAILTLPMRSISDMVSKVLFPSLTALKGSTERIRGIYFKVCRTIVLIVAPVMIFICVYADILVLLVLGDRWLAMVPIVRIFSILAINQSMGTLISNLYMAHAKTREMFYIGTILRIFLIGSIIVGLRWGILGVAVAYTVASYISSYFNHAYAGRFSGFTVKELLGNVSAILLINVGIGLILVSFRYLFLEAMNDLAFLAAALSFYALLYLTLLNALKEAVFLELKLIVAQHFKTVWRF